MTVRNPLPEPAPRIAALAQYRVPRHPAPVDLRLDGNEGACPPASLVDRLRDLAPGVLREYPSAAGLQALWAGRLGVEPARLLVTAGADEALERALKAFLAPGREIVLPEPTFEMFERYAAFAGGAVVGVPWPGGPYPVAAVLAAVTPRTSIITVVTPNNPTGAVATADDLRRLAAAAPRALLLVDLAYGEFADADLTATALALPNALVTRTLSKAWGLAGLRIGCAIGATPLVDALRAAGSPYAVSGPSLALAAAWLADGEAVVSPFVARIRAERERLVAALAALGARPQPSQANFVLGRFADAAWVRDALAGLGIAVRYWPGRPGLADALRITCPGDDGAFARLEAALGAALRPQAILFDLDGVLADTSGSFDEAIMRTAATWGVTLGRADIALARAEGDANNDWVLTRRLLRLKGGVEAALPEVTARFEALYQGTTDAPGLHATERALADRVWLDGLRARGLKLGVVTGRPRRDAERFLDGHGLSPCIDALVTMEDGPPKPDPAPVRAALARLGVTRALMIGDTPDDVRAARAAGVVPLGIAAPGEDPVAAAAALSSAGAARVLDRLADLGGLIT